MVLASTIKFLLRPRSILLIVLLLNARSLPFAHTLKFIWHIARAHLDFQRRRTIRAPTSSDIWATRTLVHTALCDDLDFNIHMNNASYNRILDHARADHLVASFGAHNAKGRRFANGGVQLWFRREIRPFQRFEVRTRLLGYDSKWFFVEHRFVIPRRRASEDVICAVGVSKQVVKREDGKTLPFEEFLELCGFGVEDGSVEAAEREARRVRGYAVVEGLFDVEAGLLDLAHSDDADES